MIKLHSEHVQTIYDSTGIFTIEIKESLTGDGMHIFDNITFYHLGEEFLHLDNLQDVETLFEILDATGIYLKHAVGLKIKE